MAKKPNLVAHFADVQELNGIEPRILAAFFLQHKPFFESKGISIPEIGQGEPKLDLQACSDALMSITIDLDEDDGDTTSPEKAIATAVDCVVTIVERSHYRCVDSMLSDIETKKLKKQLASLREELGIGKETLSYKGRVLLIWLCDHEGALDFVYNFLKAWTQNHLKEYPEKWGYVPDKGDLIPDKDRPQVKRQIGRDELEKAETRMYPYFHETYNVECKIEAYPEFADGQRWFFVSYGGRPATVEVFKEGTKKYIPLKRDIIVHDNASKVLRIKASSKKLEELYRKTFGGLLFGDEEAFLSKEVYSLAPLEQENYSKLLTPPKQLRKVIESVEITELAFTLQTAEDPEPIKIVAESKRDISRFWGRNRNAAMALQYAEFTFKFFRHRPRIKVQISADKGLSVKNEMYEFYIRDYFIQSGFCRRQQPLSLIQRDEETGIDMCRLLTTLGELVKAGSLAECRFRHYCTEQEWDFIQKYLTQKGSNDYLKTYSPPGSSVVYQVASSHGDYVLCAEEEDPELQGRPVNFNEIRLYDLNEDELARDVHAALIGSGSKTNKKDGCFYLGKQQSPETSWFLVIPRPGKANPIAKISEMKACQTPGANIIILEFPGQECATDSYASKCQQIPLDLAVTVQEVEGEYKLVRAAELDDNLATAEPSEEVKRTTQWPLEMPEYPAWNRIQISIKKSGFSDVLTPVIWIKYGEHERTFRPDELPFLMVKGEWATNASFLLLNKLIQLHQFNRKFTVKQSVDQKREGQRLLAQTRIEEQVPHSSLHRLVTGMRTFFGVTGNFYSKDKEGNCTLLFGAAKTEIIIPL